MLKLREIRREVESRASLIGAEPDDLPTYGSSQDGARPHIEVEGQAYHYVVVERGEELERRTFGDLDGLLSAVFEDVTFVIACRWELANRVPTQDFRRLLFQRQLELLGLLSPEWARRRNEHLQLVLREHPYRDEIPPE